MTWAYNNAAVMLLPAVISRAAGRPYLDFVRAELFDRLDIRRWYWRCDDAGNPYGMAAAHVNAHDLALIAQLLAQNGTWEKEPLLTPDWVSLCRRPPLPDVRGAGLLMFDRWAYDRRDDDPIAFGHDGSGGQHLWIYPASRLVIARLRDNRLPDGQGFEPSTPEQCFRDLPQLGARLDAHLRDGK